MISRTLSIAFVAPAVASGALLFSAGPASAASDSFTAKLSGANEVGSSGQASVTGTATITVDTSSGKVCAKVTTTVKDAAASHIHKGGSAANGPVVVALDLKSINGPSTCVTAKADVAKAIAANPAGYYVNVHTPAKPAGAERGQLTAASAGTSGTPSGVSAGSGGQAGTGSGPNGMLVVVVVAGVGLAGAAGWRLARR